MTETKPAPPMDKIVALCKRRGFIFQSSEIYGGINGFWDYGPAGAELKRNIKDAWWNDVVRSRTDVVGIDGTIITHPRVWEASGHTTAFTDPMVDCRSCKKRYRADQLCEENGKPLIIETGSAAERKFRLPVGVVCPSCGSKDLTEPRPFNLMFQTYIGPLQDESSVSYLRPETAQIIFAQFLNVLSVSRQKVPFGIAQIGKAFRNEINPRNFTFRSREFEQMELEFFVKPGTDADWHKYWVDERLKWYESIGLPASKLSCYNYKKEELAHYASACVDVMFEFPFGVQELEGIAARGDFDLSQHQKFSGKSMEYFDDETKEKYIPHVVEPSAGVDRIALALICSAYAEEELEGETRVVMRFAPRIAPVKVAVFPLLRNKPPLVEKARQVFKLLQPHFTTEWDDRGNIGKRYRYQDEQGTPWCVTIDFETIGEKGPELQDTVTLRDRDTMKQERVKISDLVSLILQKLRG
ncbi:MAG TPA: glycine--tRNA ligase [Verrucomicrobiae bacterium]|nr:glycine--tRNA ligase [Verrucomicrobiae bacterium]